MEICSESWVILVREGDLWKEWEKLVGLDKLEGG